MDRVAWAQNLAGHLLADALPRRWSHVQSVGRRAESIAYIVGNQAETLICAAWLHDIGYSPELISTGFHALDGARYLRDTEDADDRLCRLVAHHSYALFEGRNRGLASTLITEFPPVRGLTADALTYCDMTTDPGGSYVAVEVRLSEILRRYGEDDVVHRSIQAASTKIIGAVTRIQDRISNDEQG